MWILGSESVEEVFNNYFFYISSTNWKIRTSCCILFHTFLIYSCRTELLPLILLAIPFLKLEIVSFVQTKKNTVILGSNFTSHHHIRGIPMIFWNNCAKLEWIILRKSGHASPLKTLPISKFTTLNLPYPDNNNYVSFHVWTFLIDSSSVCVCVCVSMFSLSLLFNTIFGTDWSVILWSIWKS